MMAKKKYYTHIYGVLFGILLPFILWYFLTDVYGVSKRYLPSISDTFQAAINLNPNIFWHTFITFKRLLIGTLFGLTVGLLAILTLYSSNTFRYIMLPTVQSLRAIPAIAMVPFFLLWFGFSDLGKYILITAGIATNLIVAGLQILHRIPENYDVFFKSFGINPKRLPIRFLLPYLLEYMLPTVRFLVAMSLGLVIVAELLGAQSGLGFLIQSSRSTFATHTIMLACLFAGVCAVLADYLICSIFYLIVFWKRDQLK